MAVPELEKVIVSLSRAARSSRGLRQPSRDTDNARHIKILMVLRVVGEHVQRRDGSSRAAQGTRGS